MDVSIPVANFECQKTGEKFSGFMLSTEVAQSVFSPTHGTFTLGVL